MIERRLLGVGGALALLGGMLAAPAPADGSLTIDLIDSAAYPTVEIVVSATPGLDFTADPAETLTLTEGGEERAVTARRLPVDDLQVMLVIDTSGSMADTSIVAARGAAIGFVDAMPPEVPIGLASGGDAATVLLAPTADHADLRAAIAELEASGETSIYDAVVAASEAFVPDRPDRAMVVLSDGGDTVSAATLDDAVAASTGVRMRIVELLTSDSNRVALERLAGSSGAVASATDPAALDALYRDAAGAIANRYAVVYESDAVGSTAITIRLATPAGELSVTESVLLGPVDAAPAVPASTPAVVPGPTIPGVDVTPTIPAVVATLPPTFVVEPAPAVGDGPGNVRLWVGAVFAFVALVAAGLVIAPSDPGRRLGRRRLGVRQRPDGEPERLRQRLTQLGDRALERSGQRGRFSQALEAAGSNLSAGELAAFTFVGALVAGGVGQVVAGPILALAAFAVVCLVAVWVLRSSAERRRRAFVEALPEVLQLMVGALRAGYGLMQALDAVSQQAPEPARTEFQRVLFETRFGRDPGEALEAMATRMRSPDAAWVVTAIEINRDVGGDLAQTMDTVADTIRERQRLQRQVQALTAEGRISAYILAVLPAALGGLLALINPGYFEPLGRGVGLAMLVVAAVLLVIGIAWMRRLVNSVGGAT